MDTCFELNDISGRGINFIDIPGNINFFGGIEEMENFTEEDGTFTGAGVSVDKVICIKNYPDIEKVNAELAKLKKCVSFNANAIAKELGARGNMVLLGAAAPYLESAFDELEKAIKSIFGRKGDAVVETNIKAIRAGRDAK